MDQTFGLVSLEAQGLKSSWIGEDERLEVKLVDLRLKKRLQRKALNRPGASCGTVQ